MADRSDIEAVPGELDSEIAADESDIGAVVGAVGGVAGAEETDGEPSAEASSINAIADGSDMVEALS